MYLLDTNVLIWTLTSPEMLTDSVLDVVTNTDNKLYTSIGSLWEIAIKQSIGKLDINSSITEIADECKREDIEVLSIQPSHLAVLRNLPFIHRDPFDRLYISQAISEGLTLITSDSIIPQYSVKTLWK